MTEHDPFEYPTDSESFIHEETIPSKEQAMQKMEFAFSDIQEQIRQNKKTLILRTSHKSSSHCLRYTSRTKLKFERDLHCLHQVYDLLENDKKSTKRELFYENKALYEVQANLDRSIKSMCKLLDESRLNLNVLACGRGLIYGAITFLVKDCGVVDARVKEVLITDSLLYSELISEAQFILVVEKDTTFQKLIDEKFQIIFPRGILVTSKGYPDISTRNILRMLSEKQKIPIYGIFDADPHGIEIYLTYKYGAIKESAEGRGAFVPPIEWNGLFPSDSDRYPFHPSQFLPLTRGNHIKIQNMIPRSIQLKEALVTRELDRMLHNQFKMELEAVNLCGPEFMARFFIAPRLGTVDIGVHGMIYRPNPPISPIQSVPLGGSQGLTSDSESSAVDSDAERMMDYMIECDSD